MARMLLVCVLAAVLAAPAHAGYPCCYKTYSAATYAAPAPITDPNWRAKHADLKYHLAKIAADSSDYQASIASFAGHPLGYGSVSPSVAAAGTAIYSTSEYARGYGADTLLQARSQTLDPHVMASQRNRFLEHVVGLTKDVNQQTDEAAKVEHANNLELEKLRAATEGYERIVKAAAVPESRKTVTQYGPASTVSSTTSEHRETVYGSTARAGGGDRQAFIDATCVSCHSKANPQGGVILSDYAALAADIKARCAELVDSDDPTQRMPKVKTADGYGPGKKLPLAQKLHFAHD